MFYIKVSNLTAMPSLTEQGLNPISIARRDYNSQDTNKRPLLPVQLQTKTTHKVSFELKQYIREIDISFVTIINENISKFAWKDNAIFIMYFPILFVTYDSCFY